MSVNQGKNEPSLNHIPISPPRERPTATARDRVIMSVADLILGHRVHLARSHTHTFLRPILPSWA